MRIVIDMQGAQTESRFRGIGRYTMSFVKALVRNRGENEVILVLSGLFPDTIEFIRSDFGDLLSQENIRVWHAPGPVRQSDPDNESRRKVAELIREAFLTSLKPDVIHITSLFEGFIDDAVTSIGCFDLQTPVTVTLFDLIPLLNPEEYLESNLAYSRYFYEKVKYLNNAERCLSISEFARIEGLTSLGKAEAEIINISTAIDDKFKPVTFDAELGKSMLHQYGVLRPFVLYVGGADERKNLPRLIKAYGSLSKKLRKKYQLVFVGHMPEGNVLKLRSLGATLGLGDDELVFTGYISDDVLLMFYNLCRLFVFPSWHEGFGLSALEAMASGAAVIGSNKTSIPEVIGLDETL
jgi:glycosyltransferase involved in cell wall biosynthesis